ncbi:MAG: hypothetical protein IPJ81_09170 [Chitinophagaceae bacterium]|nr:hypothetical protein [Chitinophagaceae bacterium]
MGNAIITTAVGFTITSSLIVQGTFSASAGTATFSGTCALHGTANLFAVTISSGATLQLYANALLGIASTFTRTGTLNVTSTVPNTVEFKSSGAQSVVTGTYHHLTVSNGNTKSASNNITVNGDLTINASTTFYAGALAYTHNYLGSFINGGAFTSVNTINIFSGSSNATISGATTFTNLTINKSSSANVVTLGSNINVGTLTMTTGNINTGSNTLTITTTRSGNGLIWGTITRTHTFTGSTNYFFEGPVTSVTFLSPSVTSVTMTVTKGAIADFPYGSSVNRTYDISVSGTYSGATVQLHYEDDELNGNTESSMELWRYNGTSWVVSGKNSNNTTTNFVTKSLAPDATNRWTIGDVTPNVVRWDGSSSTAWATAANWTTVQGTPSTPPSSTDIVLIGTAAFTNQPSITTARSVRSIQFGSAQAATLSLSSSGTLTTGGNITGTWSANRTHTISVGSRTLTVGGDLALSNGTSSRIINLTASTGTINVSGNLTESGGANITFSSSGALSIGKDFNYVSGTFTPSTSTVTYDGSAAQAVGVVSYNNLVINKASGIAAGDVSTINNNLTITVGRLEFGSSYLTIGGDVSIAASSTLLGSSNVTEVQGSWSNSGTFVPGIAGVYFSGSTGCTISASTFYFITIDKSSGAATLTGNISINNGLDVSSGTLDLSTFTANSTSLGGGFSVSSGATLKVGGAANFPSSYINYSFVSGSTVEYNGTVAQAVEGVTYGHLIFSNGTTNAKTLGSAATVAGNLTINSGATFTATSGIINLSGNWINSGTFTASSPGNSGAIILSGTSKTITGTTTFNKAYIHGSYTVSSGNMTFIDELRIIPGGSYDASTSTTTLSGDFTNKGTFTSNGAVIFSGTAAQTISLTNAMSLGGSNGVVFSGTVSPTLRAASSYEFNNLDINNTVFSADPWTVAGNLSIGSGGALIQDASTIHTFMGERVTNDGTIDSKGTIIFSPARAPQDVQLAGVEFTSTGTVIFDAAYPITTIGVPSFNDVIISNTETVTPGDDWTIGRNFIINDVSDFAAGANTYSVAGNIYIVVAPSMRKHLLLICLPLREVFMEVMA